MVWRCTLAVGSRMENRQACFVLVDGIGEHVGRYDHVAAALAKTGMLCWVLTCAGTANPAGRRGHTPSDDAFLTGHGRDFLKRWRTLPRFTTLHLWTQPGRDPGAQLCLAPQTRNTGVIVTAPWLKLAYEPRAWNKIRADSCMPWLLGTFLPTMAIPTKLDARGSFLTCPEVVVQDYRIDPLVHDRCRAAQFTANN